MILWCLLAGALPTAAQEKQISGSSLFGMDDIMDAPLLLSKLQADSNPLTKPVYRYLSGKLDAATKQLLVDPSSTLPQRQSALVQELNKILRGNALYNRARFVGVPLRPETQSMIEQNPTGDRLMLVNRLLLEDAYPLEIVRNQISYLGSSVIDEIEGLYRHDVVVREGHDQVVALTWHDHATELLSFKVYKFYLLAIGKVGTSSESLSVLNITENRLSDFLLCREPMVSPNGRYISYFQFLPRHTAPPDIRMLDISLVFDLDASTNDISGIAKDEGWVSLAANKGRVVYPKGFLGKRVFPVSPENSGHGTVKARAWAKDSHRLFLVIQQDTGLEAVLKDLESSGKESLSGEIDLRDVFDHLTEEAVSGLKVKGIEMSNENTMVILFWPGPGINKDQVTVKLQ
ncbi:MAG: hypothetical protein ACRERU_16655 [Methylococcales bacterium]